MNLTFGILCCNFCNTGFNCSAGLSNKKSAQTFAFCCPNCSGVLSIEIDPHRSPNHKLINISRSKSNAGVGLNLKSIKLHLDFPTFIANGYVPISPFMLAVHGLKNGRNIAHFKHVTNELNFYSENILTLHSFFNFYKNNKTKELLLTSKMLLREDFYNIIDEDDDFINGISIFTYLTTREVDIWFYKTLFGISTPLNELKNPNDDIDSAASYLSGMDKDKLCNFHSYLSKNGYLQSSAKTTNSIYSNIYSNEEFFRPSIYLYDYSDIDYKKQKSPLRLVSEKIEVILGIYKDLVEIISKQYTLILGLQNIKKRKGHNKLIKNIVRRGNNTKYVNNLLDFSNLDLGMKLEFMDDCYCHDEIKGIQYKIRNSIAHKNWEYNELRQDVTFFHNKGISNKNSGSETRHTILEINCEIIRLFRLMHKINNMYYLFNYFGGCRDYNEKDNVATETLLLGQ